MRIDQQIVKSEVVKAVNAAPQPLPVEKVVKVAMVRRPETLPSETRQIKPPGSEHAYYITLAWRTDLGTPRLWEIFINTQDTEKTYLLTALTRLASAAFREIENPRFLIDEWKSSTDPTGGFWKDGRYHPGLLCGIAHFMEYIIAKITGKDGVPTAASESAQDTPLDEGETQPVEQKKRAQCKSCGEWAVVYQGGCDKCLACGFSERCKE